jgi:hypothetical protein
MEFNGKKYFYIERNLFGEIAIDGNILNAGDSIIILRLDKDQPFEDFDNIYFGPLGLSNVSGFQLLVNTDLNNPYDSVYGLLARIPE